MSSDSQSFWAVCKACFFFSSSILVYVLFCVFNSSYYPFLHFDCVFVIFVGVSVFCTNVIIYVPTYFKRCVPMCIFVLYGPFFHSTTLDYNVI